MDDALTKLAEQSSAGTESKLQLAAREYLRAKATADEVCGKLNAIIAQQKTLVEDAERAVRDAMRDAGVTDFTLSGGDAPDVAFAMTLCQAPRVTDWEAFHAWVLQTGNTHYLQRRVTSAPFVETYQNLCETHAQMDASDRPPLEIFIADNFIPGATVSEWKELKVKAVPKPKPRRARA